MSRSDPFEEERSKRRSASGGPGRARGRGWYWGGYWGGIGVGVGLPRDDDMDHLGEQFDGMGGDPGSGGGSAADAGSSA